MSIPIDPFTALPVATRNQPDSRPDYRRDSRDDQRSSRAPERSNDPSRNNDDMRARNTRLNTPIEETSRSDFQRHLDDDVADKAARNPFQDHADKSVDKTVNETTLETTGEAGNKTSGSDQNPFQSKTTNHGEIVSQLARSMNAGNKGAAIKSVATARDAAASATDIKSNPEVSATPGDGESHTVTQPGVNAEPPAHPDTQQAQARASVPSDASAATIANTSQTDAAQTDAVKVDTKVDTKIGSKIISGDTPSPVDAATTSEPVTSQTTEAPAEAPVPAATTAEPTSKLAAVPGEEQGSQSGPSFNENARKTDDATRPGWGADNAPRSERGTLARSLKADNAQTQGAENPETVATLSGDTDTQSPQGTAATTSIPGETPAVSSASNDEDSTADGLAATQTNPDTQNWQTAAAFTAGQGEPTPFSATTGKTIAGASGGQASEISPKGLQGATPAEQRAAQAGQAGQAGQVDASAKSGKTAKPGTAQTTADHNASSTGAANAASKGQAAVLNAQAIQAATSAATSGTSQGTTPTPEMLEQALAGKGKTSTDKRGTERTDKTGLKDGKAKSATGLTQPAGADSKPVKAATNNAAAQGAAAQTAAQTATQTATQHNDQQPRLQPAPVLTDPTAMGGLDMAMNRANAPLEVDPVTGALHVSGTGSAKMSARNISEVNLQFSRARMIQTPAKDIAVQIAKHQANGVNRFDIRISPPELGRIEIRLEIADSGKVSAHLVADKPETLELLQKDKATLEKAMAEAGLDTDSDSLDFSMRDDNQDEDKDFKNYGLEVADDASDGHGAAGLETLADLEVSAYGFDIVRTKRLDISI